MPGMKKPRGRPVEHPRPEGSAGDTQALKVGAGNLGGAQNRRHGELAGRKCSCPVCYSGDAGDMSEAARLAVISWVSRANRKKISPVVLVTLRIVTCTASSGGGSLDK